MTLTCGKTKEAASSRLRSGRGVSCTSICHVVQLVVSNMLFLWELVSRAFWESFTFVGGTPGTVLVWSIGAIITALLVLLFRGRDAFMEHLKANILIAIAGAVLTLLLVFGWKLAWLPYEIRQESSRILPPDPPKIRPPQNANEKTPSFSLHEKHSTSRHLTNKQKTDLVAALSPYKEQKFAIDCAVNDPEAHRFAEDIRDSLDKAGWKMKSYWPVWDAGFSSALNWQNYFGVQWFEREDAPHISTARVLRQALKNCCRITADGVDWPDPANRMEKDIIYVWVGPNDAVVNH
jgi:hypothetical protein